MLNLQEEERQAMVVNRLSKTFQRNKGDDITKEYHEKKFNNKNYFDFAEDLILDKFSVEECVNFFIKIHAKYVIITAKHHDGFCLFPTKTRDLFLKKDILKELAINLKKNNIKFGIYYSILEFEENMNLKYMNNIVKIQLLELQKMYSPDIFWFDGDWSMKECHIKIFNTVLETLLVNNSKLLINDRLGKNNIFRKNILVFEDRY